MLRLLWSIGWPVVNAAAFITVTLAQLELGPGWLQEDLPVAVALVVLAIALVAGPVGEGLSRFLHTSREVDRDRVELILKGLLIRLTRDHGIDCTEIGVHAFKVRRRFPKLWDHKLARCGRVRLKPPRESRVEWTIGKGAIGQCWESGDDQVHNVADLKNQLRACTKEEWDGKDPRDRMWLSWEDANATSHYGAIAASPIRDFNGDFIGCVSVDSPPGFTTRLRSEKVRGLMQLTATHLAAVILPTRRLWKR